MAGGFNFMDTLMRVLAGAGQGALQAGAANPTGDGSGMTATEGAIMGGLSGLVSGDQNANTQAVIAGANAPGRAPAGAAQIQGLTMQAQNPQLAQAPAQPTTGLNVAMQAPTQLPAPTIGFGDMSGQHPMTQGVGNWSGTPAAEPGFWDSAISTLSNGWNTAVQNMTGRDAQGNPLQGQDLANFQKGHAMGAFLGGLGAAVGGENTFGGQLGKGIYQQSAGNLSAMNAERQQMNQNDYMTAAARAMTGGQQGQQSQAPSGPEGPIKQPTGVYTPQTSGGGTGEPAEGANRTNASTYSLDETLNRMRRLNSGMF